jgi:hypothetical protein
MLHETLKLVGSYEHACMYTYSFIPWIPKFVMATIGCGIHHKDTKCTVKCSNNKTETTQTKC